MRGEQAREANAIAEQHVADFSASPRSLSVAPSCRPPIFFKAPACPGLPRELHRRCIGQVLALPAEAGLDQSAEEQPDIADDQQANRHGDQRRRVLRPAEAAVLEDLPADEGQHQDSEQQADQADVQAHVAIEDVAEFVGDHALQLVAIEPVQRAAGDRDHRIRSRVAAANALMPASCSA
jgi:hypothetical protein